MENHRVERLNSSGYLQIYRGYDWFRRHEGRIIKSDLGETKGITIHYQGNEFIVVNGHLGMSEQVKTLIHEFLHFSYDPQGDLSFYLCWNDRKRYDDLEDRIEKATLEIYDNQRILVKHLRNLLLAVSYRDNYRLELGRLSKKGFPA